jgi:hypothetical protein
LMKLILQTYTALPLNTFGRLHLIVGQALRLARR